MSSAYGKIERPKTYDTVKLQALLPIESKTKTDRIISIHWFTSLLENVEDSSKFISHLRDLLNYEVESGNTYPQNTLLSLTEFQNYFLANDTFIVLNGDKNQGKESIQEPEGNVLGMFYVKPNFPGRCSHICNGGFVTAAQHRNQGVGKLMGSTFLEIAPILGYKASMFNLVFVNNTASIRIWRSLNFQEIGRISNAGCLKKSRDNNEEEYVDAIMFYYDFYSKSK